MIHQYPVCHRNREDCQPIECVASAPDGLTQDEYWEFQWEPKSFVCSGCVSDPKVKQDKYRLCFKNHCSDEMSDNDLQDLTSIIKVASCALNLDAVRKVNQGIVEIPAENEKPD